jgi:hypothetical protein
MEAAALMPNRILREGINSSSRVAQLDWAQEVFYRRLHSVVDDYGRTEALPQLLRARCYPLQTDRVRAADITRWIAACEKAGLLLGYTVDGKEYLELTDFRQKQRSPSKHPPPPANAIKCRQMPADASLGVCEGVCVSEGEIAASGSMEVPESLRTPAFESAWKDWEAHRREKKKPITPTSRKEQIATLAEMGPTRAIAALRHSIRNGYTGIFEDKSNGTHQRSNAGSGRNLGTANEGRSSQYTGVGKVQ